jgi:hypothetical protein
MDDFCAVRDLRSQDGLVPSNPQDHLSSRPSLNGMESSPALQLRSRYVRSTRFTTTQTNASALL